MTSSKAVISVGVGQRFAQGLKRLMTGLVANGFSGGTHLWGEYPEGCPTHEEIPYGFKPWAFDWARRQGYKEVLWLDSACVPVKPLSKLFRMMKKGYVFAYSPLRIWEWCSDACAEKMGISRENLHGLCPSMWATAMGLNFNTPIANAFLDRWLEHSHDGVTFHGDFENLDGSVSDDPEVKGHRHDQTVATILAFEMGMGFDWGVVAYDTGNAMPLDPTPDQVRIPNYPAIVLSNHNVKTKAHSD